MFFNPLHVDITTVGLWTRINEKVPRIEAPSIEMLSVQRVKWFVHSNLMFVNVYI